MKRKPLELETMLQEGYTRRFAKRYLTQLGKENEMSCFDTEYRRWAHEYGFYVENASSYRLSLLLKPGQASTGTRVWKA